MTIATTLAEFLVTTSYDNLPDQAVDHAADLDLPGGVHVVDGRLERRGSGIGAGGIGGSVVVLFQICDPDALASPIAAHGCLGAMDGETDDRKYRCNTLGARV